MIIPHSEHTSKGNGMVYQRDTCTSGFTAALFTNRELWCRTDVYEQKNKENVLYMHRLLFGHIKNYSL